MRDPKRIRKFCDQLAEIWESQCPDWRFGQLFMNVLTRDPFYMEDDEMMETIKKYFHLDEMRGEVNGDGKHKQGQFEDGLDSECFAPGGCNMQNL